MHMMINVALGAVAVGVIGALGMFAFSAMTPRPNNLGIKNGQLTPAPASPNCVSSTATDDVHKIQPFTFSGPAKDAVTKLKSIVRSMTGSNIVVEEERYLHAEFRSRIFRYVDDVEFLVHADDQLIHFRSASRVGHSDLGVNRARMEAIREQFQE